MIKRGTILLAAFLAVSSAFALDANAAPTPHHGSATIRAVTARPEVVSAPGDVTCSTTGGTIDRTSSCLHGQLDISFYEEPSHTYVGYSEINWTSHVRLDPRNRHKWTDDVTLTQTATDVPASEIGEATVSETCGSCTSTGGATQILTVGATKTYHLVLDSPGTATITDAQAPHLVFTAPPFTPVDTDLGPKINVRCDNTPQMSPVQDGGCVYPDVTPTYNISVTGPYDQVAWHIDWAQRNLGHHWGWQGHGPALTRTMDKSLIKRNRRTACPSSIPRPSGKSCDEYPFASTYQGASLNPDFSCHMVPEAQNSNEGNYRKQWYNANRLFEREKFWVNVTDIPAGARAQTMRPLVQCP
ncbi:hypothetical protein AAW14_01010 [Streptomyces hygroscopicus]|uniref:NucA/NucB deoxyribonuclease domain-containing protein n=1 Tax=Streptomyces hygroscopicus TaxID=1912 RepID=UPI00223F2F24|nr:NucA/NucB deoxyribonuclease domain-containing protein [Streptomyces hygroscopicus]MCW7940655.1 hypothetical protein [Streptomyces hygroscopicus]